jgi:hypothetical protein
VLLSGDSGDSGAAADAQLIEPRSIAVTPAGDLLIADYVASRIRLVNMTTGIITTIVNVDGGAGPPSSGLPAATSRIIGPDALTVDATGAFYFADNGARSYWKAAPDADTGVLTLYQLTNLGESDPPDLVYSSVITPDGAILQSQSVKIRKMVWQTFSPCPIDTAAMSLRTKASSVDRVWPWPGARPKVVLPPNHSPKYDQLIRFD